MNGRAVFWGIVTPLVLATLGPFAAGGPQDGDPLSLDVPAQVLALLESRCSGCHAPDSEEPKAKRDWDGAHDLAATREQLVEPGAPDLSDLWLVIDEDEMPPPDSEALPLTLEERALLHDWIASGAPLGAFGAGALDETTDSPSMSSPGTRWDAKSAPGAKVRRWVARFHPSIVHFPIALLLAAALAELLVLLGARGLQPAVRFCVLLGTLGALTAASVGWLAGEFALQTKEPHLTWHRWLGVTTAVLALVLLLASEARVRQAGPSPWTARTRWLLLLTAVAVSVTGHLGGILTHGVDALSLPW